MCIFVPAKHFTSLSFRLGGAHPLLHTACAFNKIDFRWAYSPWIQRVVLPSKLRLHTALTVSEASTTHRKQPNVRNARIVRSHWVLHIFRGLSRFMCDLNSFWFTNTQEEQEARNKKKEKKTNHGEKAQAKNIIWFIKLFHDLFFAWRMNRKDFFKIVARCSHYVRRCVYHSITLPTITSHILCALSDLLSRMSSFPPSAAHFQPPLPPAPSIRFFFSSSASYF